MCIWWAWQQWPIERKTRRRLWTWNWNTNSLSKTIDCKCIKSWRSVPGKSMWEEKKTCILQNIRMWTPHPDVASALDRINLSDTKFTILAEAITKANGQDLDDGPLSRSTVSRNRSVHRSAIDRIVRKEFHSNERQQIIVHWDGKWMRDRTNKKDQKCNVDRLAVCVTGHEVYKILGIAKMQSGTGEAHANATHQLLVLWEVQDDIVGMCFNTTSSNTRSQSRACVQLENYSEEICYTWHASIMCMNWSRGGGLFSIVWALKRSNYSSLWAFSTITVQD